MKLTDSERSLLESHRRKRLEEKLRKKREAEEWATAQARLDQPGWCAGCHKSERQVWRERRYVGNKLVNGDGVVQFYQIVSGGVMGPETVEAKATLRYCFRCFSRVLAKVKP